MHTIQKTTLLTHVPTRATRDNITAILNTMNVLDVRADKAHSRGNFNLATRHSVFVAELDALVAVYKGDLPEMEF